MDKPSFLALLKALRNKRMIVVLCLGFSSGLPIMLLFKSLKIWLRREGIDLSTIGYMSWVTLPYTFNFAWAALFDRYIPFAALGRRRSGLLITQVGLVASLIGLGFTNPSLSLPGVILLATLVCFASASQDIVVDAYRREILPDHELGIGAAMGVYGYRMGMLVASGFGLWIVDQNTWALTYQQMFRVMAAFMGVGILTTWLCSEPHLDVALPPTLKQAVVEPFLEFFKRPGAVLILLFILFFKMGDSIAGAMLSPFYVDIGFTDAQIGVITSGLGFFSTMAGLFLGGVLLFRYGYYKPMLIVGILQALSTLAFVALGQTGANPAVLSGVVFFEDFTSGMGTAALVAFMSSLTNRRFTAAQYALFASLASFGRTFFSGFSGKIITVMGYSNFFILCAAMALPGLFLLYKMFQIQKGDGVFTHEAK